MMKPLLLLAALALLAADAKPADGPYANDFQSAQVGKPPEDLFLLNGNFSVREESGNRFLELAGSPLDTMGLLLGPDGHPALDVSARISATTTGRLFPEFGVGANNAPGYKLWLMPGPKKMAIRKGEDSTPLAQGDFAGWKSGEWTNVRLRVSQVAGKWKAEGKAWPAGQKEPEVWGVSLHLPKPPEAGRASLWGVPFSDTPIRFDDLKAVPIEAGK